MKVGKAEPCWPVFCKECRQAISPLEQNKKKLFKNLISKFFSRDSKIKYYTVHLSVH